MGFVEVLTVLFCVIGVFFMLLSTIGLLRLPDVYTRGHSAGKAGTLGIIGVLFGVGLNHGDILTAAKMSALILFFLITSPVAAQIVERSAFVTKVPAVPSDAPNEMLGRYDEQGQLH